MRLFDHDGDDPKYANDCGDSARADAAESKTLAQANLRYQIAQEAWTRAVLLQQPEIAKWMGTDFVAVIRRGLWVDKLRRVA